METLTLLQRATASYPNPIKLSNDNWCCFNRNASLAFPHQFPSQNLSLRVRKSAIVEAKKSKNNKEDTHSFFSKPDEATGPFPEAVLLKEKKLQEDGQFLPEFADAEEEKLYKSLNLELESQWKLDNMRHYEVVYLIHEKHAEQVDSVNEKVQEFLRELKGKIWRISDWGMRRLAYKIQKANNAHYMLMNFELEAKWINDFKGMLDKDERVIRHLVIKRDEAITEDCPPPPEFHTIRGGADDEDDDEDFDDDEDWDDDEDDDMEEDGIIIVDEDDNDGYESGRVTEKGRRIPVGEKVGR